MSEKKEAEQPDLFAPEPTPDELWWQAQIEADERRRKEYQPPRHKTLHKPERSPGDQAE